MIPSIIALTCFLVVGATGMVLLAFGSSLGPTISNAQGAPTLEKDGTLKAGQVIITPAKTPLKPDSHIRILHGNLAPGGSVAKITGKEGERFTGTWGISVA